VPSKDDKTFWDYAPNIFPILLAVGFFIYAQFFSEGRDSTSAFFAGLSILAIFWALSVRESLKSIERSMEQLRKSIERDFLGHWWGELDDDKEEEKCFERSIAGRLQSIEFSLKSIKHDFSPHYPEGSTEKEEERLYEQSITGRLLSIELGLKSIQHNFSGDWSELMTEKERYERYKSSIPGRLQSIEHTLKSIKDGLKATESKPDTIEGHQPPPNVKFPPEDLP
jgi:hypothetical protein